jgi:spore coat protein A
VKLNRRDLLKMSVLGGAALALPLERALGEPLTLANRIAESALPAPFTIPFTVPPVISPVRSDATTDYFRVSVDPATASSRGTRPRCGGTTARCPGPRSG